jgi:hypothetical protein
MKSDKKLKKCNHVVHQIYNMDETEVFLDGRGGGG